MLCCFVISPCEISIAFSFILNLKLKCFKKVLTKEIIIDSVSPATVNPGVVLPNEDYALFFNVSNPDR